MRRLVWMGTLFAALSAGGRALGAEPPCCQPPGDRFLERLGPVGGWCPYGTGPLCWWNPHWFPHWGGHDDYERKPLPAFWRHPYACDPVGTAPQRSCPGSNGP
jgi:hypothetical protein